MLYIYKHVYIYKLMDIFIKYYKPINIINHQSWKNHYKLKIFFSVISPLSYTHTHTDIYNLFPQNWNFSVHAGL